MERLASIVCLCALSAVADMLLPEDGLSDCARLVCPIGVICLLVGWLQEIFRWGGGA